MNRVAWLRRWHGRIGPLLVLPLLNSAVTGVSYRIAKDWFGLERDRVHWLMALHEGEWLGQRGETLVVLLNGLGLVWMLATGSSLAWQSLRRGWQKNRESLR
ncbi:MAG: PepSY domain-containing protein [Aphanocapsa feldmannii 277cV]|uniref:PepSY domain-containing protein n=2 Tax=Aphanocapsa feldmannii TaxID=192050 RepID=A0A524RPM5_9CHRO|nr:MAG: PepSY domain-containing protein [Aphanocapsa feldmannii 288cV]TGG93771.1 MAG: PepSY domain-containing protein [Aphanocapsa feldmannii 277cV]TGH20188.1 MAG: PepSY domain-containing protein [Aphanocapsa feldmannii 277cI]